MIYLATFWPLSYAPEAPHEVEELVVVEVPWDGAADHLAVDVQHRLRKWHVAQAPQHGAQLGVVDRASSASMKNDVVESHIKYCK